MFLCGLRHVFRLRPVQTPRVLEALWADLSTWPAVTLAPDRKPRASTCSSAAQAADPSIACEPVRQSGWAAPRARGSADRAGGAVNGVMKWRAAAEEAAARVLGEELSDSRGSRRSRWPVNLARRHD